MNSPRVYPVLGIIFTVFLIFAVIPVSAEGTDGYIRIAKSYGPTSIDGASNGMPFADNLMILETLVDNVDNVWTPKLATSWKQTDDKTWEFTIRDGVKFHDGTPLNAEAVKKSLDHALAVNPTLTNLMKADSVSTSGENTIIIRTKEPVAYFPAVLVYPYLGIISPSSFDSSGTVTKAIGTGAMKLKDFDQSTGKVVAEKNPDYWGGEVKANGIIITKVPDPNTRAIALQNNEVDITHSLATADVQRVNNLDGISVKLFERPYAQMIDFNMDHPVMQDKKVRQAISYAIDRSSICTDALYGTAKPAAGVVNPKMPWGNPSLATLTYDPEKAKILLDEAGWKNTGGDGIREKDGKKLKLSFIASSSSADVPSIVAAIADQLKEVGISVDVSLLESSALNDRRDSRDWDIMWAHGTAGMIPDAAYALVSWYDSKAPANYAHYSNPDVDDKIKMANSVKGQDARNRAYDEIQQIVYDDMCSVALYYPTLNVGLHDNVKGFKQELLNHDLKMYPGTYI